jgi:hypothetical protein
MAVQLGRLFGAASREATNKTRTPAQWKMTLRKVLSELSGYLEANVDTDEVHRGMLRSGLAAAYHSLEEDDFWPGYVEGITRITLVLMGDYPGHQKRRSSRLSETASHESALHLLRERDRQGTTGAGVRR